MRPSTKIRNPDPGPTLPGPAEPVPFAVPRMSDPSKLTVPVRPAVWRVSEVELEGIATWLVPALRRDWPNMSEAGVMSFLKAAIGDKQTIFVRSENVVGLATASFDMMDPAPIVRERFVRSREKANDEAALLYRFIQDWAVAIGAFEFRYGEDTDASMTDVSRGLFDPKRGVTVQKRSVYAAILRE